MVGHGYEDMNPNLVNDTRGLYEATTEEFPLNFWNDTANTSSVYDYAVTSIWPVLLNIYYKDDSMNMSFSDFKCLRAQNISEGSRTPDTLGVRQPLIPDSWGAQAVRPIMCPALATAAIMTFLFVI